MSIADVAQQVLGLDEVVAGVDVAAVLHRQRVTAGLGVDALTTTRAHPRREGRVEGPDEHLTNVVANPFVKDLGEEPAPTLRGSPSGW